MEFVSALMASVPTAPGTPMGAVPAVLGTATNAPQEAPTMCQNPPPEEPKASMPDDWRGPALHGQGSGAGSDYGQPAADDEGRATQGPLGHYYSVRAIDTYGDWLRRGTKGERAAKAVTGLVVLPYAATLTCLEDTARFPVGIFWLVVRAIKG